MKVIINQTIGYNWQLNVVDNNNNVLYTITDTQSVLDYHVKHWNRLKKRKGQYTMSIDIKEYNELINK